MICSTTRVLLLASTLVVLLPSGGALPGSGAFEPICVNNGPVPETCIQCARTDFRCGPRHDCVAVITIDEPWYDFNLLRPFLCPPL